MNNQTVAQVTLHNNTGNSDKIYECVVVRSGDLYLVNTQNGRRGGSMTPRTKTKEPVPLEAAMKIFDAVVKEKKADNYYVLEDDNAVAAPAASNDPTGAFHQPQLLNDIDRDAALALIQDDDWVMEEKMVSALPWPSALLPFASPTNQPAHAACRRRSSMQSGRLQA
jgi:hypothetical protein